MAKLRDLLAGMGQQVREDAFWRWFKANLAKLAAIQTGQEPVFMQAYQQIQRVHPDLLCEFAKGKDGVREVVISADGKRAAFGAVENLVARAPVILGWKVTAFRSRKSLDFSIRLDDRDITADDIWFDTTANGTELDLQLYIKGLNNDTLEMLAQAAFLMLDFSLGEYDVETKLGSIDFSALPPSPDVMGLHPLKELPAVVDGFSK